MSTIPVPRHARYRWDLPGRTQKPHIYLYEGAWLFRATFVAFDRNRKAREWCEARNR